MSQQTQAIEQPDFTVWANQVGKVPTGKVVCSTERRHGNVQRIFRLRGWDGTRRDQRLGQNLHLLCDGNEFDRSNRVQSLLRRHRIAPRRFFHNEFGGCQLPMLMRNSSPFTRLGLPRRCEGIATGASREV